MAIPVINLSSLDGTNGFRMDGVTDGDHSGFSVSNAGDVNGDGFDDVIMGAPLANPSEGNGYPLGSSYVVFGKASGFSAAIALSSLDGNNGFRLDGGTAHILERSGSSVSGAGDINGDGYDDLVVGAPRAASYYGDSIDGYSYVVLGKATGFNAALDLSSSGFGMAGSYESYLGGSVSSAGDINGDGFDDVIIGASGYRNTSYVFFGKTSGFSTTSLNRLDGSNGFWIISDNSGSPVSSAGDVNGDGFDDVIVGGSVSYVVFGKATGFDARLDVINLDGDSGFSVTGEAGNRSVSDAGDVNGDGIDDFTVGNSVIFGRISGFGATLDVASLDGSNGFRLYGSGGIIGSAGDVNGDGFDDVIAGGADVKGDGSGSSYVVFGKSSGFDAILDLANLNENAGFRLDGAAAGDKAGFSVSGAGDVNDDGFDDLLIGAPEASPNDVTQAGSSYVIFGRSDFGGGGDVIPGTPGDDVLRGTLAAEIFEAGDGNDLLIGRGGVDVFRGGTGVDQIKVPDLSFQSIDGGSGNDILHLDGRDQHLDLAIIGDKIQGVETICIYGRGDNTLALTADSVLELSDTSNTLKLHGNAGDRVTVLDGGWLDGGVNGFYHTYVNDDAVLLVGANLAIDFV
ncbi:MAG: hypothetical protein E6Q62_10775 [Nitrosomonas sp.]|nr:MAG: hypothetical protein E6Q62_10775 [Nitrosomonas sp.]